MTNPRYRWTFLPVLACLFAGGGIEFNDFIESLKV